MRYPPPASSTEGRYLANRGRMSSRGVSNGAQVMQLHCGLKPSKGPPRTTLLSYLYLDDSALESDHRRVGTVIGVQFGEDIPDLAFDCFFADRQMRRYLFVGISFGNQAEDADFRRTERVIGGMLGKLICSINGKRLLA